VPCLAPFFYAMFGVKKLTKSVPEINFPTSANEPSTIRANIFIHYKAIQTRGGINEVIVCS